MKRYIKPTLVVNNYSKVIVNLCNEKSIVESEVVVWIPNGIKNGIK